MPWSPPGMLFTCHVTATLMAFVTVARKSCELPTTTDAGVGEILTVTLEVSDTTAEADLVGSATDTAVMVTVFGFGITCGAVKSPPPVMVPVAKLPPTTESTCQVTEVLEEFWTTAANCAVWLIWTVLGGDGSVTDTLGGGPPGEELPLPPQPIRT